MLFIQFIVNLFTISRKWKQPNCLSVDNQNVVHIHKGIHKGKNFLQIKVKFAGKLKEVENHEYL